MKHDAQTVFALADALRSEGTPLSVDLSPRWHEYAGRVLTALAARGVRLVIDPPADQCRTYVARDAPGTYTRCTCREGHAGPHRYGT